MNNRKRGAQSLAAWSAMAVALMATDAQATVLTNIQGTVAVDRGNGFQPVSVTSTVAVGDRVRCLSGSADIIYDNGMVQKVMQSQTVAVLSGGAGAGAGGGGGAPAAEDASSSDLLLIGATVGVGIGVGVGLAEGINNRNSSVVPIEGGGVGGGPRGESP